MCINPLQVAWIGILKEDENYWENLATLARLGYRGMEGGDNLLSGNQLARFHDLGLRVLTISGDIKAMADGNYGEMIQKAHTLGTDFVTAFCCSINASFWGETPTYDGVMQDIETMEKSAEVFAKEGLTLCYHNHYQDFTTSFHGSKAFDLLLQNSSKLKIELDTGWALNGRENPVELMERIAPRLAAIHVKDYRNGECRIGEPGYQPVFTSVGNGILPLREILLTAQKLKLSWAVVEQDELEKLSPIEALTAAYLNMKETGTI